MLFMFVVLQMISAVSQNSLSSLWRTILRNTSAITISSQQICRKMSSQSIDEKFQLPKRYQGQTPSVWYVMAVKSYLSSYFFEWVYISLLRNEYIQLFMKYQPLNLGQGFTDYPVPKYITDALAATANSPNCLLNQYTRGFVSYILSLINFLFPSEKLCDR